jgi:methylenetetrahydrofolate--tRNA-(uracil-5-)-methyltransferase
MGGLVAGLNMVRLLQGQPLLELPPTTMIGALLHYITHAEPAGFQPMKAAMGLLPPLETEVRGKRARYGSYAERAAADLEAYLDEVGFTLVATAAAKGEAGL